jgi:hypothetical protein
MSTTQLVLELFLLRERFTKAQIEAARVAIKRSASDPILSDLIETLAAIRDARPVKEPRKSEVSLHDKRDMFLKSIGGRKSASARKRLLSIAKRLDIDPRGTHLEEDVAAKVSAMDDEQLSIFLRPLKASGGADQAYLGLANYLIDNKK